MTESTPTENLQSTTLKTPQKLPKPAIKKSPVERRTETERMYDVLMLLDQLFRREEAALKLILSCLYDVGSVNLVNQNVKHQTANRLVKWIASLSKPIFGIIALRWFYKNCPQLLVDWLYAKLTFEKVSKKDTPPTPGAIASEVVASELGTSDLTASDITEPDTPKPDTPKPDTSAPRTLPSDPTPSPLNSTELTGADRIALDSEQPQALPPTAVMPTIVGTSLLNSSTSGSLAPTVASSRMVSLTELESADRELVRLRSRIRVLTVMLLGVTITLGSGVVWLASDYAGDSRQISSPLGTTPPHKVGDRPPEL